MLENIIVLVDDLEQFGKGIGRRRRMCVEIFTYNDLPGISLQAEMFYIVSGQWGRECIGYQFAKDDALCLPFQFGNVAGAFLISVESRFHILDHCIQLVFVEGLSKIAAHAASDGFLGIFKIGITAKNNAFSLITGFSGPADNFCTVHFRHSDIQQGKTGLQGKNLCQGVFSIGSFSAQTKPQGFPVCDIFEPLSDRGFVISDK